MRVPLHHYTEALGGFVISGKVSHPVPGNESSEAALGPGAFFSFAAGEPHETNNEGEEPALFFIFQDHPWILEMD